jgi:excisionase family DNA binding protein
MADDLAILSVTDVAKLLGCSKAHVCKAIHGQIRGVTPLPAISMGRRKLVRRRTLEVWLERNDTGAGAMMKRSQAGSAVGA